MAYFLFTFYYIKNNNHDNVLDDELVAAFARYFGIAVRPGAKLAWRDGGVDWSKPKPAV